MSTDFGTITSDQPASLKEGTNKCGNSADRVCASILAPVHSDPDPATQIQTTITLSERKNEDVKIRTDGKGSYKTSTDLDSRSKLTTPSKRSRSTPTRVSWDERVIALRAYKEEHGDLAIPIRYKKDRSLGKFVHNTREQYKLFHNMTKPGYKKKCSLTQERIDQLEEIGFLWNTQRVAKQNQEWEVRFEQLRQYKQDNGTCMVPHGYEKDPGLAEWVHRQRTIYATMMTQHEPNPTTVKRMNKLTGMDFTFTVHVDKWREHFEKLCHYKKLNGHCQVPTHYKEDPQLGRWTHTQRHQRRLQLKGKRSCMTDDRVKLLNDLGFSWAVRPNTERQNKNWQTYYDDLKRHASIKGTCSVSEAENAELAAWCHDQRKLLRNLPTSAQLMPVEKVSALANLGFTADSKLLEQKSGISIFDSLRPSIGLGPIGEQQLDSRPPATDSPIHQEKNCMARSTSSDIYDAVTKNMSP